MVLLLGVKLIEVNEWGHRESDLCLMLEEEGNIFDDDKRAERILNESKTVQCMLLDVQMLVRHLFSIILQPEFW